MAKITDFKFEIAGKKYIVHVNCRSDGNFSANLPKEVASPLDLREKMEAGTLTELSKKFYDALDRYKTASIKQEMFIAIRYMSAGRFQKAKDGSYFHQGYQDKYKLELQWESGTIDALAFHFTVVIKETTDGVEKLFKAQLGKDFSHIQDEHNAPDKWQKEREFSTYHKDKWKFIPFSQQALTTLKTAQEKIRQVSEALFHFVEQDEEQILLTLTKNKLLTN